MYDLGIHFSSLSLLNINEQEPQKATGTHSVSSISQFGAIHSVKRIVHACVAETLILMQWCTAPTLLPG